MRMGPFSDPAVIRLLNEYFVPVQASTSAYLQKEKTPRSETELLQEIWKAAKEKNLSQGTVHVYALAPNGKLHDSRHVSDAMQVGSLVRFLRKVILELDVKSGDKLVLEKRPRNIPRETKDRVVLRVAAEYSNQTGTLGEDWVVLERDAWKSFRSEGRSLNESWDIPLEVAQKMLVHLYPLSQDWDVSHNAFSVCRLAAKVISRDSKKGDTVAIRGHMLMQHNRYTNRSPEPVKAEIVGTVSFGRKGKPTFRITTGEATYGGRSFDGLIVTQP